MRPAKPAVREQTGDNRKGLLNLSLAKPRQKAAATVLVYELFINGDIQHESHKSINIY
jgi:hypothetical protein